MRGTWMHVHAVWVSQLNTWSKNFEHSLLFSIIFEINFMLLRGQRWVTRHDFQVSTNLAEFRDPLWCTQPQLSGRTRAHVLCWSINSPTPIWTPLLGTWNTSVEIKFNSDSKYSCFLTVLNEPWSFYCVHIHTMGDSWTSLHERYTRNQHVVVMNVMYPYEITTPNPLILMILKNIYVYFVNFVWQEHLNTTWVQVQVILNQWWVQIIFNYQYLAVETPK